MARTSHIRASLVGLAGLAALQLVALAIDATAGRARAGLAEDSAPRAELPIATPQLRAVPFVLRGATPLDRFRRPVALAADQERGMFVVGDTGNGRLVMFDARGRSRGAIGLSVQGARVNTAVPCAVAIDPRGRLIVLDEVSRQIEILSSTGSRIAILDPPLSQDLGAGTMPLDLACGKSGRIYILYAGARPGILVLEPNGRRAVEIGFAPVAESAMRGPVAIAVDDPETMIALVDPLADEVVHLFSTAGEPLLTFGEHGEGEGTFSLPSAATWNPNGTLWIADAVRHAVVAFTAEGKYLGSAGTFGRAPGQLNYPAACAFLTNDRLLVLDRASGRCQLWDFGSGESEPSVLTAHNDTESASEAPATPDALHPSSERR
jgi:sugar lactone lactonase YvrE